MKISVVIPVFNEEKTILDILRLVTESIRALGYDKEVIVVDDGSTDGTPALLSGTGAQGLVDRVILNQQNVGKGAALHQGFSVATGAVVIVQDADLEYDPKDYGKLITPIVEGKADAVLGSRYLPSHEAHFVVKYRHTLMNRCLTAFSNLLTNLMLTDVHCCYKAFSIELIGQLKLREKRFAFDPEVVAKLARMPRVRLMEVRVSYLPRTTVEGKKIGWRDGVSALRCNILCNLGLR